MLGPRLSDVIEVDTAAELILVVEDLRPAQRAAGIRVDESGGYACARARGRGVACGNSPLEIRAATPPCSSHCVRPDLLELRAALRIWSIWYSFAE